MRGFYGVRDPESYPPLIVFCGVVFFTSLVMMEVLDWTSLWWFPVLLVVAEVALFARYRLLRCQRHVDALVNIGEEERFEPMPWQMSDELLDELEYQIARYQEDMDVDRHTAILRLFIEGGEYE